MINSEDFKQLYCENFNGTEFEIKNENFIQMFKTIILIDKKFKQKMKLKKSKVYLGIEKYDVLSLNFHVNYNDIIYNEIEYIHPEIILRSNLNIDFHICEIINNISKKIYERIFNNIKITVCDKCLIASCWNGEFMCEESQYAGIIEKTVKELRKLHLEHEDNWKKQIQIT